MNAKRKELRALNEAAWEKRIGIFIHYNMK